MSGLDLSSVTGAAPLPADIRAAGPQAQQTYRSALAFERQLIGELTKTMSPGATGASEGEDGESQGDSAATSAYRDMLPGIMADSLTNAGGLGLARDLYRAMRSGS